MSKINFRGLIGKIFGDKKVKEGTRFELVNTSSSYFLPWSGNLLESDVIRACIRPVVNSVGKLSPKHIRAGQIMPQPYIRRILERPNPFMTMQDFLVKMTWQLELTHNAFAYVKRDNLGYAQEIYPIAYSSIELIEANGVVLAKFRFRTGESMSIDYQELIHLRKDFSNNDIYGTGGVVTLNNVMEIINTTDQGIVNAVKNSAVIKWILKFKSVLKPEDRELQVSEFVKNYLRIDNTGGAAASDPRYDIEQVEDKQFVPVAEQLKDIYQRLYSYWGVNEAIIQNNYSEDQWNSFYSGRIEPIAIQFSDAFTYALFTEKERSFGNKIIFSANRLTFASNSTKINMARDLLPLGLFTINEMREVLELEPVEGGDKRMITLNVVNADKQDQYQIDNEDGGGQNDTSN